MLGGLEEVRDELGAPAFAGVVAGAYSLVEAFRPRLVDGFRCGLCHVATPAVRTPVTVSRLARIAAVALSLASWVSRVVDDSLPGLT